MKARLFVLGGRDVGRSFTVEDEIVFGRGTECGARLGDRSISRRHARVACEGGVWFVEDLDSRNGVRVSGKRLKRRELSDHDEFTLGEVPIRFRDGEAAAPAVPLVAPEEPVLTTSAPAPAPALVVEGLEDEIELDEIELEDDDAAPAARSAAPVAPPVVLPERELQRARIIADDGSRGFLRGDLDQRPLWVRTLVFLFVLALGAGTFFLAFRLVQSMRETL